MADFKKLELCIKVRRYVCKYLKFIEFNKILSDHTCQAYRIDLRQLLISCIAEGGGFWPQNTREAFIDVSQNETFPARGSGFFSNTPPGAAAAAAPPPAAAAPPHAPPFPLQTSAPPGTPAPWHQLPRST